MGKERCLDPIELTRFLDEQSRRRPRGANLLGGGKFFPLSFSTRIPMGPAPVEDGIIPDEDFVAEVDLSQGKETVVLDKVA